MSRTRLCNNFLLIIPGSATEEEEEEEEEEESGLVTFGVDARSSLTYFAVKLSSVYGRTDYNCTFGEGGRSHDTRSLIPDSTQYPEVQPGDDGGKGVADQCSH